MPTHSISERRCFASSGSSIGCVVNQKCSFTYSDGLRLRCGTSSRNFSKCWSMRQIVDGIQPKPPSMKTIFSFGKRSGMPSSTRLVSEAATVCAFALMLLAIIGRPAAAGRRVAAIAADMDAERQAELLRAGIDRPVAAAAERLVGARRDVDLDVFAGLGAAVDLGDRKLRVVLPGQDRGLQARDRGATRTPAASR